MCESGPGRSEARRGGPAAPQDSSRGGSSVVLSPSVHPALPSWPPLVSSQQEPTGPLESLTAAYAARENPTSSQPGDGFRPHPRPRPAPPIPAPSTGTRQYGAFSEKRGQRFCTPTCKGHPWVFGSMQSLTPEVRGSASLTSTQVTPKFPACGPDFGPHRNGALILKCACKCKSPACFKYECEKLQTGREPRWFSARAALFPGVRNGAAREAPTVLQGAERPRGKAVSSPGQWHWVRETPGETVTLNRAPNDISFDGLCGTSPMNPPLLHVETRLRHLVGTTGFASQQHRVARSRLFTYFYDSMPLTAEATPPPPQKTNLAKF